MELVSDPYSLDLLYSSMGWLGQSPLDRVVKLLTQKPGFCALLDGSTHMGQCFPPATSLPIASHPWDRAKSSPYSGFLPSRQDTCPAYSGPPVSRKQGAVLALYRRLV